MSKKIDAALKQLTKALKEHADVVGGSAVSLKKAQRASAKVAKTASAYAEAVHSKSGMGNPFDEMLQPGLEPATIKSLNDERDALVKATTGAIPVVAKTVAEKAVAEKTVAPKTDAAKTVAAKT